MNKELYELEIALIEDANQEKSFFGKLKALLKISAIANRA